MELREALAQISEIRQQVARTEVFRGYRAVPVAFSGVLALVIAGLQTVWVPEPLEDVAIYLALWVGAAAVLSAYAAQSAGRVSRWRAYQLANALGSAGLGAAAAHHHSWPSAVLNGLWMLIAFAALGRGSRAPDGRVHNGRHDRVC